MNIPRAARRRARRDRRGASLYIAVLGTATIVSVLGLSTLLAVHLQRMSLAGAADVLQARLNAQMALRIGMLRIEADPEWRFNNPHGTWIVTDAYSLNAVDPTDGDLTSAATDPVVLTGTGRSGAAVQRLQITLVPTNQGPGCLNVALFAEQGVDFANSTLECDQLIATNGDVTASFSSIYSTVEAANEITGATYHYPTRSGVAPRAMPNAADVLDYYVANGTPIPITAIPLGYPNQLRNPGFEDGLAGWSASTSPECSIQLESAVVRTGDYALLVTDRTHQNSGPVQDVSYYLKSGETYYSEAWIRRVAGAGHARIRLDFKDTVDGGQALQGDWFPVDATWTLITATLTPTWSGELDSAQLSIRTQSTADDFYVDDLVLQQQSTDRVIYGETLSPTRNPFGDNATDPLGVYVIDCQNEPLVIDRSRIVGTLVLLNPAGGSARPVIRGPMHWQPALPNFPALLVDGSLTVAVRDMLLSEDPLQRNFNPPGTPFPGLGENTTLTDNYPSLVQGLVWCAGDLYLERTPVLDGVLLAAGEARFTGANARLTYSPFHRRSPPPGFSGDDEVRVLLNSIRKTTQ